MPAYFSVVFQFRRKELYPGFVSDFYRDLGQRVIEIGKG